MPNRTVSSPYSALRKLAFAVRNDGKLGSCYLAGPMTGLPDFNAHAFRTVTRHLRVCGWTVFSPAERDEKAGISLEGYPTGDLAELKAKSAFSFRESFLWDLEQVCTRDAVIVMPGWEESVGATIEVQVALLVGTPVYTYLSQRRITELPEREPGFSSQVLPEGGGAVATSTDAEPSARDAVAPLSSGEVRADDRAPSGSSQELSPGSAQSASGGAGDADLAPPTPSLPDGSADRKALPVTSGVLDYFPAALAAVAAVSKYGNDKHNPGEPLHHARGKSMDHADSIARHLIDRGHIDPDTGQRHTAELAWRALALLQQELEDAGEAPLPRGAKL